MLAKTITIHSIKEESKGKDQEDFNFKPDKKKAKSDDPKVKKEYDKEKKKFC